MKKYHVHFEEVHHYECVVMAENEEDAKRIAEEESEDCGYENCDEWCDDISFAGIWEGI